MKGVFGKIKTINCRDRKCHEETVPASIYEKFLGGKGLASYLLLKKNPAGVDPLSPDNKLILATGPANGFSGLGSKQIRRFHQISSNRDLLGSLFRRKSLPSHRQNRV